MGLSEDVISSLARTVWGGHGHEIDERHVLDETGLDLTDPALRRVLRLTHEMIGMPRHLGQHVGGFILTDRLLTETVPIGNGAMPERSFIEWDKDDIDELGIFKVDVLGLGSPRRSPVCALRRPASALSPIISPMRRRRAMSASRSYKRAPRRARAQTAPALSASCANWIFSYSGSYARNSRAPPIAGRSRIITRASRIFMAAPAA
jgi:hypothetical protein